MLRSDFGLKEVGKSRWNVKKWGVDDDEVVGIEMYIFEMKVGEEDVKRKWGWREERRGIREEELGGDES